MKDFDIWNIKKKNIENKGRLLVKKGDVFWCNLGLNIGTEYDGKNSDFSRPVLIIKKFSNETILILPLTTQIKNKDWYYKLNIKGKKAVAILNQLRVVDVKRLRGKRLVAISENTISDILEKLFTLIKT